MIKKIISFFFLISWIGIIAILFPFYHFWVQYNTYLDMKKPGKITYYDMYAELEKENPEISKSTLSKVVNDVANEYGLSHWREWIKSLTNAPWDENNFFSYSESQSLYLYAIEWGDFWNVALHHQEQPKDSLLRGKVIRGKDWKYLDNALKRAVCPDYLVVYHGVEFMEDEFWDQLKPYVDQQGKYVWQNAIGKTIDSYGFISTTLVEEVASQYNNGLNWTNNTIHLPLQEPTIFKIYIPKGASGVAYVSDFILGGIFANVEAQIMLKKDSKYQIFDYQKVGKDNIFSLYYLG